MPAAQADQGPLFLPLNPDLRGVPEASQRDPGVQVCSKDQWFSMRAVVTGVAEPNLLQNDRIKRQALELHKKVLTQVKMCKNRKSEEFRILRKGLAYSLSVVVQAIPEEGFEYLKELVTSQDRDILWILKQNLKKNRLIKNFPSKVRIISKQLK